MADGRRGEAPWFGSPPEALLLLEVDLARGEESRVLLLELADGSGGAGVDVSLGFGRRFFADPEILGREHRCASPPGLEPLSFNGDNRLEPAPSTDAAHLLVAAGGNWEAVVEAAPRLRRRLAAGDAVARSVHLGSRLAGNRDHTGFSDGTSNLQELDDESWGRCVFVQPGDPDPWTGATYLVLRKYEEDLAMWNSLKPTVQEGLIGRRKGSGAFLDGSHAWSPEAWDRTPPTAHIRRVHPRSTSFGPEGAWRERIFRSSIPYQESRAGDVSCGLLFLALSRDPHAQVERLHNERLLPTAGGETRDFFLGSGYVIPRRSVSYLVPPSLPGLLARLDGGGGGGR